MVKTATSVGVLFGGPSPEHDVSVLTGLQAVRALRDVPGVELVRALYWSKTGTWHLVDGDIEASEFINGPPTHSAPADLRLGPDGGFAVQKGRLSQRAELLKIDAAIVCCHGGPGEDGTLQSALDLAGLPYVGPTAIGAALGMDKLATRSLMAAVGVPVLSRLALYGSSKEPDFSGPYIVKPRFGGSSIGIDVVADYPTALARLHSNVHLRRGAVIEPYRPDLFDLQVAVRSWPSVTLSAIERPLRQGTPGEILGYGDKYVGGEGMLSAPRELPANLDEHLVAQLRELAVEAAGVLGIRGVARIDFLSNGKALFLNEVNTIPGSLSRHLFIEPPLAFTALLGGLIEEAMNNPASEFSSAGADGTVLRSAGAIAAKLA